MIRASRLLHFMQIVACALLVASCAHTTPPFKDRAGKMLAASIAEEAYLDTPGARQYLLLRGRDRVRPAVLFVHGGPGGSETALMRAFNAELEDDLVMAYWDQRGAGKSYSPEIPLSTMTVAQFLQDMDQVVDHVRWRLLRQTRVVVLGHCWGATLGMLYAQRFPEKVSGYIGVGQTSSRKAEWRAYEFVLSEASRRRDAAALSDLERIGTPPYTHDQSHVRDHWLHRYRGYTHADLSLAYVLWCGLRTPEAGLKDLFRMWPALHFSQRAFESELALFDLTEAVPALDVPVTFILGRYDQRTPAQLAEAYLSRLRAPVKRLAWLDNSAHNGPFEEPAAFRRHVIEAVRAYQSWAAGTSP